MQEMTKEQQKALAEKLKNMSPEELMEFQKKQCVFCQIISGKIDSKKIYEDDKSVAIMDINPASPGHILLLPKEHYSIFPQVPDEIVKHLGIVAKKLSHAILKALKVGGTTIFIANGGVAGQRAQHVIIHIIPRNENDGVGISIPQKKASESELIKAYSAVKPKVEDLFGQAKTFNTQNNGNSGAEFTGQKKADMGKVGYISSDKAKKFHVGNCPFAQKISGASRLKLSKEDMVYRGKSPCECTGLPVPKSDGRGRKKGMVKNKKSVGKAPRAGIKKKIQKKKNKKYKDERVSLDEIAGLFS